MNRSLLGASVFGLSKSRVLREHAASKFKLRYTSPTIDGLPHSLEWLRVYQLPALYIHLFHHFYLLLPMDGQSISSSANLMGIATGGTTVLGLAFYRSHLLKWKYHALEELLNVTEEIWTAKSHLLQNWGLRDNIQERLISYVLPIVVFQGSLLMFDLGSTVKF